jgi:hypothetical protein
MGGRFINGSGAWRGEVANVRLDVIASAAKQSIPTFFVLDGLLRCARNDGLMRSSRQTLSRRRPRRRAIQYSEAPMMESMGRGVLDTPLSRSMTVFARSEAKTHPIVPGMTRHVPLLLPAFEIVGILPAKPETPPQGAAETIRAGDTR